MKTIKSKVQLCSIGIFIILFSQLAIPKLFEFQLGLRFICVVVAVCLCLASVDFKNKNI
ncbi:hypothetical protein [Streptococcus phocae]|uniref:hypothetical protein n=1 Tax=Streptococcus phocae TaxID=119224 RepID=UPI000A5250F1|nr:hypothetical protein [Streptococcus phocae]